MNCSACGTSIDAGSRFCKSCGQPIAAAPYTQPYAPASGSFVRPLDGRRIAGVCAGIALHFGWDVTLVRLGFVLAVLLGLSGCLVYVIAWIVMPNGEYFLPPMPPAGYPQEPYPTSQTPGPTAS